MPHPEKQYRWTWELTSPPAALWPLVSNTDRFNRDCGYPPVSRVQPPPDAGPATVTNARRLRATVLGVPIEWDELAFEWAAPERFSVERRYLRGPLERMIIACELTPRTGGGTTLSYSMRLTPSGWLGWLTLPLTIGRYAGPKMEAVFRKYDEFALRGMRVSALAQRPSLAAGAADRLDAIAHKLVGDQQQPRDLVDRLVQHVATADDLSVARIRPYALADEWKSSRRDTLHLFLHATRAGLLDFSWDSVCPHCRGAKPGPRSLDQVSATAHCDSCGIDFSVNLDRSVELTFSPSSSIRAVTKIDYCIGGPQVTPHILAQQSVGPNEQRTVRLDVDPGRYRVRTSGPAGIHSINLVPTGPSVLAIDLDTPRDDEPALAPGGELTLVNRSSGACLAAIEHLAWTDQATTAAEVSSLQLFRDLFSREVLRPGEQISVGTMTIVFTDLKNSTQLYQQIGDAPAFGRVLTHFDVLKAAVAAEDGCIVKTMGDAIMAVFPRPVAAVRAILRGQRELAQPPSKPVGSGLAVSPLPLALKASVHVGPCLAINQNDRLDYFGTTVNLAARLCGQCTGTDVVISAAVHADREVSSLFAKGAVTVSQPEYARLKGFGDSTFEIRRITAA